MGITTIASLDDLRQIDAEDGYLDGTVPLEELQAQDPSFADRLLESGLIDQEGNLPYASYYQRFEQAKVVWEELASDISRIPVVDALRLGGKMEEILANVRIRYANPFGLGLHAKTRLREPKSLFSDILFAAPVRYWAALSGRQYQTVQHEGYRRFKERLFQSEPRYTDNAPERLFEAAARYFIDSLPTLVDFKLTVQEREEWLARMRDISVKDQVTPDQEHQTTSLMAGSLAFLALYTFPKFEDSLWGNILDEVTLNINPIYPTYPIGPFSPDDPREEPNQFRALFFTEPKNPLVVKTRGWATCYFDLVGDEITLQQEPDQSPLRPDSGDGARPLPHEIGHLLYFHGYERSWGEWFLDPITPVSDRRRVDEIVHFFQSLSKKEYEDIFRTTYGHPDHFPFPQNLVYMPDDEAHSVLIELTMLGYHFPRIVWQRLIDAGWPPEKAHQVFEKLGDFRSIIIDAWGFQGLPAWAT